MKKIKVTELSLDSLVLDSIKKQEEAKWKRKQEAKRIVRELDKEQTEKRRQAMLANVDVADRRLVEILGNACVDCGLVCGYGIYICVDVGTHREHNRAPYWNAEQDAVCAKGRAELLCPTCHSIRYWKQVNPKHLELLK